MAEDLTYARVVRTLRERTGVVIPVYLPPAVAAGQGEALLRDTVGTYAELLGDPSRVCVSVDGESSASVAVAEFCGAAAVLFHVFADNMGKLHAAAVGVRGLLARHPDLDYVAVIDQDGDHFANELPNLIRAALHVADTAETDNVLIIGQRRSLHRPMGFLRGELEDLIDRVLLEALNYHAAVTGQPLHLEYAAMLGEYPDFQSGFKVFSRATATAVFLSEPRKAGVSDVAYYRHAVEAVMCVEALLAGAYLGGANRSTFNGQPISTFGNLDRARLFADKVIWPCRRLGVPPVFVRQWLARHAPRLVLNTLSPQGREEIESVRRLVLREFGLEAEPSAAREPLFL
jgi:hypothetical protein